MSTTRYTTRDYAAIIPDLRRLGYHADLIPGHAGAPTLTVGRHDDAHILFDGSWRRDDGQAGPDPASLLAAYRADRLREARRHLASTDLKGMARDLIELDHGTPVSAIHAARLDRDGLHADYRAWNRPPETIILPEPAATLARLLDRLEASWILD